MVEGVRGKPRNLGLGAYPNELNLKDARDKRYELNRLLAESLDPEEVRDGKKLIAAHERGLAKTVDDVINEFIDAKIKVKGKLPRTQERLVQLLNNYIRKPLGPLPIALINKSMMLEKTGLESLWIKNHPTAKYVRNLLRRLFSYAIEKDYYKKSNPTDNLGAILPTTQEVGHETVHRDVGFKWKQMGWFMERLRAHRLRSNGSWSIGGTRSTNSLWLEFVALTGCRVNEARIATWNNIDKENLIWRCPPEEHKTGGRNRSEKSKEERSIRRPITEPMMAILDEMDRRFPDHGPNDLIFRSPFKSGGALDRKGLNMFIKFTLKWPTKLQPHGFRNTLKDWCRSEHPQWAPLIEMQFGHTTGNKTDQAYARDDLLEERRPVMKFWGEYCSRPAPEPSTGTTNVRDLAEHRRKTA